MPSSSDTPSRRFRLAAGPVLVVTEAEDKSGLSPLVESIEGIVTALGGRCSRVAYGAGVLTALRHERPLLIAIMVTPELREGDDLISGLRQRADLDDVPLVALVVDDQSEHLVRERAYRSGASDIFVLNSGELVLTAKLTAWLRLAERGHRLWSLRDFAHEVRHPIAAVGAAAHILAVSGDDPSERQRLCRSIVAESERLGRLAESYLDADAALRIGDAPITEAPLQLLRDLLDVNLPPSQRSRVALPSADELPALAVEPDQLRQMVLNLVDNALYATSAGGTVNVTARQESDGVMLSVADTGRGISPENLERIFDDGFTTRNEKQRGLGLGITRRLCARAGGRLSVSSRLGIGTEFTLFLPCA